MKNFIIVCLLLFLCCCKGPFSKKPYNDLEKMIRRFPVADRDRMMIVKDWEKMDSMTFLRFKNVRHIILDYTDTIPPWLYKYSDLRVVWGGHHKMIRNMPIELFRAKNLFSIHLEDESIRFIPEAIGNLSSLKSLLLGGNQIKELPQSISKLDSLQYISLDKNFITSIDGIFCNNKLLESLDLNDNEISAIPECLGYLSSLTSLKLENNKITDLPESIYNTPRLEVINLRGNPLRNPAEIKRRFKERGIRCVVDLPE